MSVTEGCVVHSRAGPGTAGSGPCARRAGGGGPVGRVTDLRLAYAPAGADCGAAGGYAPTLTPGEEFSVCVTVTVRIPLLPEFIDANTATGRFVVERDRYIDG
ncbi:MAG TPA: hypothetical protein VIH10_10880 [Kribbella sp.]